MSRKFLRVLGLVLACVMLVSVCAFAASESYNGGTVSYSLTCGSTSASADTDYSINGPIRSASISVECWGEYPGGVERILDSNSMNNATGYVHADCAYYYSDEVWADSSHSVNPGWKRDLSRSYGV